MLAEIQQLSVAERVQLVQDIWDTIAAHPESLAVTEAQREKLQQRLDTLEPSPEEGIAWPEFKAKIINR